MKGTTLPCNFQGFLHTATLSPSQEAHAVNVGILTPTLNHGRVRMAIVTWVEASYKTPIRGPQHQRDLVAEVKIL